MTGPLPNGILGHNPRLNVYRTDMAKAKEHLAKSKSPNGGIKLTMVYVSGLEQQRRFALILLDSLKQLNIDLEIKPMVWPDMVAACAKPETFPDFFPVYQTSNYGDPDNVAFAAYHSSRNGNWQNAVYANPEVDRMLADGVVASGVEHHLGAPLQREHAERLVGLPARRTGPRRALAVEAEQLGAEVDGRAHPAAHAVDGALLGEPRELVGGRLHPQPRTRALAADHLDGRPILRARVGVQDHPVGPHLREDRQRRREVALHRGAVADGDEEAGRDHGCHPRRTSAASVSARRPPGSPPSRSVSACERRMPRAVASWSASSR